MAGLATGDTAEYADFLRIQYLARCPIEAAFTRHAPAAIRPPAQSALIAADLADLGAPLPKAASLPFGLTDRDAFIGAAWAIAGSSLGNRAMLARRRKQCSEAPVAFLSDSAMPAFWMALKPQLAILPPPREVKAALDGAREVFGHFLRCADNVLAKAAA